MHLYELSSKFPHLQFVFVRHEFIMAANDLYRALFPATHHEYGTHVGWYLMLLAQRVCKSMVFDAYTPHLVRMQRTWDQFRSEVIREQLEEWRMVRSLMPQLTDLRECISTCHLSSYSQKEVPAVTIDAHKQRACETVRRREPLLLASNVTHSHVAETCALVGGNDEYFMENNVAQQIDSHEFVFRLNFHAPSQWTGHKTTHWSGTCSQIGGARNPQIFVDYISHFDRSRFSK